MINERYDSDEDWLFNKITNFKISTAQIDTFCDRVFELVSAGESETAARSKALKELLKGK